MGFTFFIYFFLLFFSLICFSYQNRWIRINQKRFYPTGWIFIIVYTLIIGLRYNVGTDYLLYKQTYLFSTYPNANFIASNDLGSFEFGYSAIINLFIKLGFSYISLFIATAFLQILFLYKFSRKYKYISVWLFFFFITSSTFFDSLNAMRQSIAFFMFLCTLAFIEEKKLIPFIISIASISLFHRSILIILPFYFFINYKLFNNRLVTASFILASFLLSQPLNDFIWNKLFPDIGGFLSGLSDASYLEQRDDLTIEGNSSSLGLAKFIYLSLDLIIIYFIKRIRTYYKQFNIEIFYNFYIIGAFIYYLCAYSITLVRLNMYFANFKFIMLAFVAYMLTHDKENKQSIDKLICLFLVVVSIMWFINSILHGTKISPFQFI